MTQREIAEKLNNFGVDDPQGESYLILERLFGVGRSTLIFERDRDFSSPDLDFVLAEREKRVPLQYIFGEWDFMGNPFFVSPDCLIPRPDTEILVEKAIEIVKNRTQGGGFEMQNAKCKMQNCSRDCLEMQNAKCKMQNCSSAGAGLTPTDCEEPNGECLQNEDSVGLAVADLCTGSGCIGLSMLMHTEVERVTLMDISEGALNMAKKNADRHGLTDRCEFILGDVCRDMPKKQFDLILSNPPYIPTKDVEELSQEVKKEPWLALDGGEDGLDIIRFLLGEGLSYLKDGGTMLIEFGYDQGEAMDALLRQKQDTGSIKSYEILYDYGKNPRVAVACKQ